ncbi:MAG: hypothetical protein FJ098_11170, partial [Deltaproteobacteria bacterium]|nr:hypothetical protein [Deltaproteobacteria bacterium]
MPARTPAPPERRAHRFLGELTKDLAPLERGARLAQWEAMTGGGDAAYSRYTDRMIAFRRVLAAPGRLEACRRHLDAVQEPSLRRRLEVVLLLLASHRMKAGVAAGITAEQARLEQLFSLHRGIVEGKALSAGEVSTILRSHRGRGLRRQAW